MRYCVICNTTTYKPTFENQNLFNSNIIILGTVAWLPDPFFVGRTRLNTKKDHDFDDDDDDDGFVSLHLWPNSYNRSRLLAKELNQ